MRPHQYFTWPRRRKTCQQTTCRTRPPSTERQGVSKSQDSYCKRSRGGLIFLVNVFLRVFAPQNPYKRAHKVKLTPEIASNDWNKRINNIFYSLLLHSTPLLVQSLYCKVGGGYLLQIRRFSWIILGNSFATRDAIPLLATPANAR